MPSSHINLALSTTRESFARHATLIASVLRRASRPLWVKCFCSGFLPESFTVEGLQVDFVALDEDNSGRSQGKAFDALQVLRDAPEWSRCLLMSGEQIAFQDIAPLHDLDLRGFFAAAGSDQPLATGEWHSTSSETDEEVEFLICEPGCLIDLGKLRRRLAPTSKDPTSRAKAAWEEFIAIRKDFQNESRYAFSALVGPRLLAMDPRWNQTASLLVTDLIPEGVVAWKGREKPWFEDDKAWGREHWNAEKCSWKALRQGWWEKPLLLEVQPGGLRRARQMAARGWKVFVEEPAPHCNAESHGALRQLAPDLFVTDAASGHLESLKSVHMLRFGSGSADEGAVGHLQGCALWLTESNLQPEHLVICGPAANSEIESFKALGYDRIAFVRRSEWPGGGLAPEALSYERMDIAQPKPLGAQADYLVVGNGVDAYLQRSVGSISATQVGIGLPIPPPPVARIMPKRAIGDNDWNPILTPLHSLWRRHLVESKICEIETPSINLVISTDLKAFEINATMLHSIVRRTSHPVHLRCYCRGFQPESFHIKNLLVEFIRVDEDRGGDYPWWSHSCSFDRLQVIYDHPLHWTRCWVMDYDQIATADLAQIYFGAFDGNLVQACSFGYPLRDVCNLPDDLRECESYEFYKMGPILNLAAMRLAGTWRILLDRHARIGSDEQKSLVAATQGRLKLLDDRWNEIVYLRDIDSSYRKHFPKLDRPESDWFENYGILHFTGGPKPWWEASKEKEPKKKERVWFKEYATWEKLRAGDWGTPHGCELLALTALEYVDDLEG